MSRYPTTGGSPFSTAALQPAASVSPGSGHHVVAGCTIVPDPDNDPDLTTAKKGRTTYCNSLASNIMIRCKKCCGLSTCNNRIS